MPEGRGPCARRPTGGWPHRQRGAQAARSIEPHPPPSGCLSPPSDAHYTPSYIAVVQEPATEVGAMRISLPLPPGVNNQYATVGNRRVLSKDAARFKRLVKQTFLGPIGSAALGEEERERLRSGYLGLYLDFYFATPLKRDLDGGLKITQDALCEALGLDDRRVVDIHLVKRIDPLNPRVEVELEAIAEWEFDRQYVLLDAADRIASE